MNNRNLAEIVFDNLKTTMGKLRSDHLDRNLRVGDIEDAIDDLEEGLKVPCGVSPSMECSIRLPSGMVLVFENKDANPEGTTYIRVLDRQGGEVAYWIESEWAEDPVGVMGAICGAMMAYEECDTPEKFYQVAADAKFPHGVEFVPYGS